MPNLSDALRPARPGWRGIALIAITYVYFLIFAQFAFLNRLAEVGIANTHLKLVMGTMAAGGILFSLLPALRSINASPAVRLRAAFMVCGIAAALTLLPIGLAGSLSIAMLIGAGLGVLTVTLVSNLPLWIGSGEGTLLRVGLGTGIGYWMCNVPPLFAASPAQQAAAASALCLLGLTLVSPASKPYRPIPVPETSGVSFPLVLLGFTALIWLDSAAFFIIQNTPALKAGTWQGHLHLWTNGVLHLVAAVASALLLRKRGMTFVLSLAALALAFACSCLHHSSQVVLASLFYPVGVSLYSVALVAYPSLLSSKLSPQQRTFRAGLIYAVAGWFGSAMGIGMAQNLHQVPSPFIAVAAAIVLVPAILHLFPHRKREVALVAVASVAALCLSWAVRGQSSHASPALPPSATQRGRTVYISEGCIHCHSQYVRPHTADVLLWGPVQTVDELRREQPPLIGNRRQGPDLSEVGGRRSPLWLKAHLFAPAAISPHSFMPSYAHLFADSNRGDDLVQYLSSLKSSSEDVHLQAEQSWTLPAASIASASLDAGAHLYAAYCATCHESNGATRLTWNSDWKRVPPDLQSGPWLHVFPDAPLQERQQSLARIIKFGIPSTDMPGHEYLPDSQVASLASWLNHRMVVPDKQATPHNPEGELR